MGRQTTPAKPAKVLLTIEEAAAMLSLGRTFTYDLVMRNQIMSVKVGRKRRIPAFALQAFVAQCVANLEEGA